MEPISNNEDFKVGVKNVQNSQKRPKLQKHDF